MTKDYTIIDSSKGLSGVKFDVSDGSLMKKIERKIYLNYFKYATEHEGATYEDFVMSIFKEDK